MDASFPPRVIAIFGPTASGKSAVAEALAARVGGEVVSADAMQMYRGLPILTNQSQRPTRLVGIWPLSHEASVAEYAELAHAAVDEILETGRTPIVAGGTGLYLRAALADLDIPPVPPPGTRQRWDRVYAAEGPERAHALLAGRDPAAAAAVHPNDRRRVVRALELADAGASLRPQDDELWSERTRHPTLIVGLDVDKAELARRIEARTLEMFRRGVEAEVRRALTCGVSATAEHVHGLREIAELPRERAIEEMNAQMRKYAAYQRKWMRRIPGLVLVDANRDAEAVADAIVTFARGPAGGVT
jgi:tRNA dimethylallyltransferase